MMLGSLFLSQPQTIDPETMSTNIFTEFLTEIRSMTKDQMRPMTDEDIQTLREDSEEIRLWWRS